VDGQASGSTLDFTFRNRETGLLYPAELKCEIEYQEYKYLVLAETGQLDHYTKPAFAALIAAGRNSCGPPALEQRTLWNAVSRSTARLDERGV
jgi:hypothetical protein